MASPSRGTLGAAEGAGGVLGDPLGGSGRTGRAPSPGGGTGGQAPPAVLPLRQSGVTRITAQNGRNPLIAHILVPVESRQRREFAAAPGALVHYPAHAPEDS